MEHTERPARHGGILYPLLLVAAIAVIVFSIIGIATMTGVVPNASTHDGADRQSGADRKGKPANRFLREETGQMRGDLRSGAGNG